MEEIREVIEDLDERVRKAQENIDVITDMMKKWEQDPLFTRAGNLGPNYYSPQTFEANLNPSLFFFLLLSVRLFVKIKVLVFS